MQEFLALRLVSSSDQRRGTSAAVGYTTPLDTGTACMYIPIHVAVAGSTAPPTTGVEIIHLSKHTAMEIVYQKSLPPEGRLVLIHLRRD